MKSNEYTKLLIPLLLAVKEAGAAILDVYDSDFGVEHKDDNSPLTLADRRSHEIIVHYLAGDARFKTQDEEDRFPPPVLSEEGRDIPYEERRLWRTFWLVDPLDGTKEFIKRNGEFTVNIALIHENSPVLGVIYVPVKDTFYFAAENLGAYKMEKSDRLKDGISLQDILDISRKLPLTVDDRYNSGQQYPMNNNEYTTNNTITVIASRSHPSPETASYLEGLRKQYGAVRLISAGSSLKFCLVAEGAADIYPRFGPTMEWDTAAGQCIVEQSGGTVLVADTHSPLQYNKKDLRNPFFIAEAPGSH